MFQITRKIWTTRVLAFILVISLQSVVWGADFERRDVRFKSQGLECAAWYYVPTEVNPEVKHPAIVMAHGFTGVKEMSLDKFADSFAKAGFAVLVFDYRYLGASEGEPRGQVFYFDQQQDYRNAITWLSLQYEVDAERIGIWGTSDSGGHVLHLGAFDRRVKAVVAQVPTINARYQNLSKSDQERRAVFYARNRVEEYKKGIVNYYPVVAPVGQPACLTQKAAYEYFTEAAKKAPNWKNQITMESLDIYKEFAPATFIHLISPTPLLMIVASEDVLTSTEGAIKAFERAGEPKKLVIFQGGHFDPYEGPQFAEVSAAATEWFEQYLKP
ncbi:alpha/beta hydrolase [Pelosinus sp. sgz500959]|uniref:alpha/beta hydrolase n=1 Tax=Pelosinus sp. sgz500959 TaxID=3242472 RepID=UPI00366E3623